jgi:Rod binding domain-containing protein
MDIHPLQTRHIDLSNLPLDRVAASTQIDQKEKINQVSRAFEAVLLRQILQESQKPSFKSKLESNTATDGIYHDMVVNQLAENISKSGSFGLAKSLSGELQRQTGAVKSHAPAAVAQPSTSASLRTVPVRGHKSQPQIANENAKCQ